MQFVLIVLLGLGAAVGYGILHDQITIRICPEYFTVAHPHLFDTESLTLLALAWGVVATWWVGLPLGALLAVSARAGPPPKRTARELLIPVGILLGCMALLAAAAGLAGYLMHRSHPFPIPHHLRDEVPQQRHAALVADFFAHNASYLSGAIGGVVLCGWTVFRRWRERRSGA